MHDPVRNFVVLQKIPSLIRPVSTHMHDPFCRLLQLLGTYIMKHMVVFAYLTWMEQLSLELIILDI